MNMKAKRILITILTLLLVVSTVHIDSFAASSSQQKKAIKAYYKILSKYSKEINSVKKGTYVYKNSNVIDGVWKDVISSSLSSSEYYKPVYSIKDINSDGIPELIIGAKYKSYGTQYDYIGGVYTFANKKAVKLINGDGSHHVVKIHKKGIIEFGDFYGAMHTGYSYEKLAKKGKKLKPVITIDCSYGKYTKIIKSGKSQSSTKEEYEKYYNKYKKNEVKISWNTLNKKALTATKNGYSSYKAYKKSK